MNKNNGFSIIELMIVIVAIATLMVVAYKSLTPGKNEREARRIVGEILDMRNATIDHFYDQFTYDEPERLTPEYAVKNNLAPKGAVLTGNKRRFRLKGDSFGKIELLRSYTKPPYLNLENGFTIVYQNISTELCSLIIPALEPHFKYVHFGSSSTGAATVKTPTQTYSLHSAMQACRDLQEGYATIIVSFY